MKSISTKIYVSRGHDTSWIFTTADSGKIIYRYKIDTLTGVPHPGIVLGQDSWGTVWVIHNHYKNGCVLIEPLQDFAEGVQCLYDSRPVFYRKEDIIDRAIEHYLQKKEYHWLTSNCQHFVNNVAQGKHYSETVDKFGDAALFAGGVMALIGMLTNNKTVAQVGLGTLLAGGAGKEFSRYIDNKAA